MKVKDPVCKMVIDKKTAASSSKYKNKKYYFCSKECEIAFNEDPAKYIK